MLERNKLIKILYAEDEEDVRDGYARALARLCDELIIAKDGQEGLELYKEHLPDIIVSDIKMPNKNGVKMVREIKKINPDVNIVFTSAHSESAYLLEAIELHVEGYLLKPVDKKSLVDLIKKLSKNILLQKENQIQREILQHIMDSDKSLSVVTDEESIAYASKAFLKIFDVEDIDELKRKHSSVLNIFEKYPSFITDEIMKDKIKNHNELFEYINSSKESNRILRLILPDSETKSFFVSISKITSQNYLLSLTDITSMEKERILTTKKAYKDKLTQIYNRNKFEEVFEYQLKQIKRNNQPLSLAIIDIDHFKDFNDTYGHLVGDEILVLLSKTIREDIRESDLFARWGGEEFVILFNNTKLNNSVELSEKFRKNIQAMKHSSKQEITASFGLCEYREGDTINSMIKRADTALYKAKNSGRNRVKSYDETL